MSFESANGFPQEPKTVGHDLSGTATIVSLLPDAKSVVNDLRKFCVFVNALPEDEYEPPSRRIVI